MLDAAVIMCLLFLFPSIITSVVPHYSLKEPSLTKISGPSVMALVFFVLRVNLVGMMVAMSDV